MQVVVDSLLTEYDSFGSGKTVLLLHGWGDDRKTFSALADALSSTFKVVSVDLPGFGKTQIPPEAWDLDSYASFLAAFLQKINAGNVYAIIGHSNGGSIAIRGLANGDLNASKLVLLASAGIRNRQNLRRGVLKVTAKVGKLVTFALPNSLKQKLRTALYQKSGSDILVSPQMQETFVRIVKQDVQQDAAQVSVPTLLIYGDKDTATPPDFGNLYDSLLSDSKLVIVKGAGHFVHHDETSHVNTLVSGFLS